METPEIILMHGRCNACEETMYVRSVNDGQRKTRRYNDYYRTSFYGLFVDGTWRNILSRCCNAKIKRARIFGASEWSADTTISLSQGNIYSHQLQR